MTQPLLIAVNGRFYRPVPDENGGSLALKIYLDKPVSYYSNEGKFQGTEKPDTWGYDGQTDPKSGRKYIWLAGPAWIAIGGELFMLRATGTGMADWLKASDYELLEF